MTNTEAIEELKRLGTELQISFESRAGQAIIKAIEALEAG